MNYVHHVMQPSLLSSPKTFSSPQIETLFPIPPLPVPGDQGPNFCLCEFAYCRYLSGIIQYLSFCVRLISLSIIHVVAYVTSSLFKSNTPLHVNTTFCLCIHLLMNTWVVPTFGYDDRVAMNSCVDPCFRFFCYVPKSGIVESAIWLSGWRGRIWQKRNFN